MSVDKQDRTEKKLSEVVGQMLKDTGRIDFKKMAEHMSNKALAHMGRTLCEEQLNRITTAANNRGNQTSE